MSTLAATQNTMLSAIKNYLDERDWNYRISEKDTDDCVLVTMRVRCNVVICRSIFDINEPNRRFGFFCYAPFAVPEDKRLAVMAFLIRVNFEIYQSKFEFDLEDGELRVVATMILRDINLSTTMVARIRSDVNTVMGDYIPSVLAIIHGNRTAEEAWQALIADEVEASDDPSTDVEDVVVDSE